ncbi:MAG TPA: deoxyribodipyrimidine photo-lyase [Egicoccus sp.]|nr:deoxyribodipyrimidine photo-lyase [Egicoccus sp.]HSK23315.1 deoxyribodipyrimidine photo-lyase [Egicoccus sp.]
MRTTVVLYTRDLRLDDHPALAAAVAEADRVVPLFVLDASILASRYAAPNRVGHLIEALADLRAGLREREGDLVVRHGDVADEVAAVCASTGAGRVRLSADHSAYARRRTRRLRDALRDSGVEVVEHPGTTVVDPGAVLPAGGDHFRVFTPYWRRWEAAPRRTPVAAPDRVPVPADLHPGDLPAWGDLVAGTRSPSVQPGGERAAQRRLHAWFEVDEVADYDDTRDRLDAQTSRLSADLHFGCLSPTRVEARVDRRRRGHDAFVRQLCWREFNTQVLAANPSLPRCDLRSQGDTWEHDEDAFAAWKAGRTGIPVIDAGMRQLRAEGWMHNRVRLLTASFLAKHLYVDWRLGAWHFMDWLVDGDLANNFAQWQWAAGTGTDSRPNRVFNPVAQARRHDPDGAYVRRHVPELAGLDASVIHAPWEAGMVGPGRKHDHGLSALDLDYPPPIVDLAEARDRFLTARGR